MRRVLVNAFSCALYAEGQMELRLDSSSRIMWKDTWQYDILTLIRGHLALKNALNNKINTIT